MTACMCMLVYAHTHTSIHSHTHTQLLGNEPDFIVAVEELEGTVVASGVVVVFDVGNAATKIL